MIDSYYYVVGSAIIVYYSAETTISVGIDTIGICVSTTTSYY